MSLTQSESLQILHLMEHAFACESVAYIGGMNSVNLEDVAPNEAVCVLIS